MSSVMRAARSILALSQPMTGSRASGSATASAATGTVVIPANSHLIPVVGGQLRPDLLLKTAAEATVGTGGGAVSIISVIGGAAHNQAPGTVLRWDPPIDNLNPTATVVTLAGATNPTFFGALKSVNIYETFGGPAPTLDAFRSKVRDFPAAIISWAGSEPADGQTVSLLERGPSRRGRDAQIFQEKFFITIISSRQDSDHARRHEGLEVVQELSDWIFDRSSVDGLVFSAPGGLQILARERVAVEDSQVWQNFYVYRLTVAITATQSKRDSRTYNDWLRTRTVWNAYDSTHVPDKAVADVTFPMLQSPKVVMAGHVVAGWDAASIEPTFDGAPVSLWSEIGSGSSRNITASGANRPTWNANGGPKNRPSVRFDGVANKMANATINLPAPATTPTYYWAVVRQVTWTANDVLWEAGTNANHDLAVLQTGSSPNIGQSNPVPAQNANNGLALLTYKLVKVLFSGSASDYVEVGQKQVAGTSAGNNDPAAGFTLGAAGSSGGFWNGDVCELWIFDVNPTETQLVALRAYAVDKYGAEIAE